MTLSIWRYCHLVSALLSSVFLIIASITGAILAFEPITEYAKGYAVDNLAEVSLHHAVEVLELNHKEVFSLAVDGNGSVVASVVDKTGNSTKIYVDIQSGDILGKPLKRPVVYEFTTNLHRSLFLKSVGRCIVGVFSLLLCLITISGFLLLIRRQGGIRYLFSPVKKENTQEYYHVTLSKWLVSPILLLAVTGVFLSAEKFSLLPETSVSQTEMQAPDLGTYEYRTLGSFKEISMSQLVLLEFPFSPDPIDYFVVKLKNRELRVHQYTGDILSGVHYHNAKLLSDLSFKLHTGQGSVSWSLVLFLTSISILFFLYSGTMIFIARKRRQAYPKPELSEKHAAEFIILIGSETGSTFRFGAALSSALVKAGKTTHMAELNTYSRYKNAKNLVVLAATYGNGEAPTNARKFSELIPTVDPTKTMKYSVVGFGSTDYPNYCAFAIQTDELLREKPRFIATTPLVKINKQSVNDFLEWVKLWSARLGVKLDIEGMHEEIQPRNLEDFKVIERSVLNDDHTFLIKVRPNKSIEFFSGDLLAVQWSDEEEYRLYSIAQISGDIVLSIKKHEFGKCSSFMEELKLNDQFKASILRNSDFHLSQKSKKVIFIANGTGIAPFLGMLSNSNVTDTHLFWGCRSRSSANIYSSMGLDLPTLAHRSYISYSRENKQYVQDLLRAESILLLDTLNSGGCIFVCGSINMQNEVLKVLEQIMPQGHCISDYQNNGQIKMDCY